MSTRIDLTGQRFGRLLVLGFDKSHNGKCYWNCKCDCGNLKSINGGDLKSGKSLSCKCLNIELSTKHHMSGTKIYLVWQNMKARCYKEYCTEYKRYGARGITVCEQWHEFEGFYKDMGGSYVEGLTFDRINVNGNYEPTNCRWVDRITQQNNRRITTTYTLFGKTDTFPNFCRLYNINYQAARGRKRKGWKLEDIFTTPPLKIKSMKLQP